MSVAVKELETVYSLRGKGVAEGAFIELNNPSDKFSQA